ncbi:aspartyl/glutamyl-tRNA(Asn/Gln) amidotransferase subunit C [Rhodothalassium salexigens DSM 2132]|uniref:Aspartyl/glutamyl-tRNA(Asn/Gln) amidotransferase subunit C n=1 Tax=Rhodothalassium salexigens DSM 2132 TaxID=1188247 RepID=A0A4R2PFB9_RHOSA|nr:Asp-tRNA(Asn)/Glu-tRNA(Gln) amidotransferase subunit GatC [Rhodothalassium salexigens]MBB4211720.1 aspartyl-tRNA(Asn)/glutamyl-tRNA(Gln) amidotransferase subunit C [Rhodothalassium salexigens DSM 2132]MBK1639181.1 Asp-tRNA(Asn)/Glu-tRNA(Gln) amidotransferase GatCAB subunit C [Rhodothalassium salexigens DSM 2132]TCP33982.1 aspartyl/glutamyl-tRNA(Asn/Gln) amidotransferase subunit C [Rhodothalassium salexigens DSM 2132]
MSVDRDTVLKIARLSRIKLEDERVEPLMGELNNILAWVEQLDGVDTTDVAPMTSAVETSLAWREDQVSDGECAEDVLKNAPVSEYGFFAVPKVIE